MLKIEKALKNARILKAVCGVSPLEFKELSVRFEEVLYINWKSKPRKRKVGGGRKGALKTATDKLFFILFYLKVYPTYDLISLLFDVDRSRPCEWVKQFMPILEEVLKRECVLPKRKIKDVKEFLESFPEVKDIFYDGTERPVQRPKKPKQQKKRYSGKKKRHTRKNGIMSDDNKRIMVVTPTKDGKIHDKRQEVKSGVLRQVPPDVDIWVDKGFEGLDKDLGRRLGDNIFMPKKKPKGKSLTTQEKEENRVISGIRIVVEQAIGGIKRFRCLTDVYRNKRGQDDKFMLACAGLWNFHLRCA